MALDSKTENKAIVKAEALRPKAKLKKLKVLEEDSYVKDLEHIITRDFFPDLPDISDKLEYLDALETNDVVKLRRLAVQRGRKSTTTPGVGSITGSVILTPSTFETPVVAPTSKQDSLDDSSASATAATLANASDSVRVASPTNSLAFCNPEPTGSMAARLRRQKQMNDRTEQSLDNYLSQYTSEDNDSFADIMEEADAKRRLKYAYLYEGQVKAHTQAETQLALPSLEQQMSGAISNAGPVQGWAYTPLNAVMYTPDNLPDSAQQLVDKAGRKQKQVVHENTRLKQRKTFVSGTASGGALTGAADGFKKPAAAPKLFSKVGKVGIDGKLIQTPDATAAAAKYKLLPTPSPRPGVDDSPLMTWGEVGSTPMRLDSPAATPAAAASAAAVFRVQPMPERDRIGMDLAERASKAHRAKKDRAISMVKQNLTGIKSPACSAMSTHERLSTLSPAARRLMSGGKLSGGKLSGLLRRKSTAIDQALRASYTPSPLPRGAAGGTTRPTPGASVRRAQAATPLTAAAAQSHLAVSPNSARLLDSVTDDLLHLPHSAHTAHTAHTAHSALGKSADPHAASSLSDAKKRKTAEDFF